MISWIIIIAIVVISYRVGRYGVGYGVAAFLAMIAIWQLVTDGPESFFASDGCERYSIHASNC